MPTAADPGEIPGIPQYGMPGRAPAVASTVDVAPEIGTGVAPATVPDQRGRLPIFWVEVAYMLVLLGGAAAYQLWPAARAFLPKAVGPIPLAVPWFGALGAVAIGLQGIFNHRHDWDSGYNLWHIARPLVGIVLAVVATLIFDAGVLATGNPRPPIAAANAPTDNIIFYLVAFIVGYREEVFRGLLQRLADVILSPSA